MELSATIHELRGSITSGNVSSMRDFQRLRKLEFPLKMTWCNIAAAAAGQYDILNEFPVGGSTDHELDLCETISSRELRLGRYIVYCNRCFSIHKSS